MVKTNNRVERVTELICELARSCQIKEEFFAASFHLSPAEVRLLRLFALNNSYSIKEIRDNMDLTGGRITQILQSLEAKKLVLRIPEDRDKRIVNVKILPKAIPLVHNLHHSYKSLHKDILKNVNNTEMDNIFISLQVLVDVFRNWVDTN